MATSGSVDFTVTRDNLINLAYQHIGVVGEGEDATSDQITEAALLLNMLVKARHTDGMPLWALKRGFILPLTGVSSMTVGSSHAVTTYVTTTLTADSAASDTTLTVDSITGITASDVIGVELDSGVMFWTTVSGSPSGSTVTLAAGVTTAASSGNRIYTYATSTRITRPLKILSANTLTPADDISGPVEVITNERYYALTNRTEATGVVQLYYDPQLTGVFYFWPRFTGGDEIVEITYHRPYEDFDATGDNPDFPQHWYLALMLELAWILSAKSSVPPEERASLFKEAQFYIELARQADYATGSIYLGPEYYA